MLLVAYDDGGRRHATARRTNNPHILLQAMSIVFKEQITGTQLKDTIQNGLLRKNLSL